MAKPIVVKIGGSTLGANDTSLEDLATLQKRGVLAVVVHGGGKAITEWLTRLNTPTRFVRGLRVTDEETLQVVVAVLAGLVNKELVAAINSRGGRAMGLSGLDGGLIQARIRDPELGYVGEVVRLDPTPLKVLLGAGYLPVVAPLALLAEGEEKGKPLNMNADTVAGDIAAALGAEKVVFLTDVEGVRDASGQVVPQLTATEARRLIASGVISGGMIPKVEACLVAASRLPARIIDGRQPHALLQELEGKMEGTTIAGA